MARRSMAGQLNMFDFWDNLVQPEDGAEVQMVSLIPEEEPKQERAEEVDEAEVVEADFKQEEAVPEKKVQEELVTQKVTLPEEEKSENNDAETLSVDKESISRLPENLESEAIPVMQKQVLNPDGSIKAEVAYYNYNKVCVKRENKPAEWRGFDNSKEAVDYYIEEMLKLQPENGFEDKGEEDE